MRLAVEHLFHVYHKGTPLETLSLQDVSFYVESGEFVSLVGHTGSGKSTLAQHLNALLLPQSGTISLDGRPAKEGDRQLRDWRRRVGLVFQYPEQQLFAETVDEELAFGPRNWGFPPEEVERRSRESLAAVGLDESLRSRSPFALSGGQQRRLAIASVLASGPEALVLDEPTAGLDTRGVGDLVFLLVRLVRQGIGVVHVTHDLEIALRTSDRILVLEEGKCAAWGTPKEVIRSLVEHPVRGLRLPPVLQVAVELRRRGFPVPLDPDPASLAGEILRGGEARCASSII
jgi:energy-coupling factor transport system ATP-binding protein